MNKILFGIFGLITLSAHASELSAHDMMVKNEDARHVSDFQANCVLVTGTKSATTGEKTKDFTLWRKIQKDGVHNSTLTRFHAPAEVREEGILILENESGKNDVLLYLPNFKKIRRVETQQQSGSFMGSVFSYSDIATPHVPDYQYKLIKTEKCPGTEAAAQTCAVIESTPANEDVKDRTGYSKSLVWIRQDNFMAVQAHYFNLEGVQFKTMQATEIKIIDAKNQKWLAHKIYIENSKTNEFTRLEFSKVKANNGIADSIFSQQNLQKTN